MLFFEGDRKSNNIYDAEMDKGERAERFSSS